MIYCAGGIILRNNYVVTVTSTEDHTGFPKGHVEKGESPIETAYREIHEECGLERRDLNCHGLVGSYVRQTTKGQDKQITLFIFTTTQKAIAPQEDDIATAQWKHLDELVGHMTFPKDLKFFERQRDLIQAVRHTQTQ